LSSNIIFSGKPKNLQKKGSFVDTTDPNAPILAPCPAESYCPGGTTLTPISCPSGTGTLGSPGAGSSDQCVPQDPCVPDPNTCCSGPITQPGWPFYGPYLCSGVGGFGTNTAVDKNVSQRRGGGRRMGFHRVILDPPRRRRRRLIPFFVPLFPCRFPSNSSNPFRTAAPAALHVAPTWPSRAAPGPAPTSRRRAPTAARAAPPAWAARRARAGPASAPVGRPSAPTASPASSRPERQSAPTARSSPARATPGESAVFLSFPLPSEPFFRNRALRRFSVLCFLFSSRSPPALSSPLSSLLTVPPRPHPGAPAASTARPAAPRPSPAAPA